MYWFLWLKSNKQSVWIFFISKYRYESSAISESASSIQDKSIIILKSEMFKNKIIWNVF